MRGVGEEGRGPVDNLRGGQLLYGQNVNSE